jgi:hypothetical protein
VEQFASKPLAPRSLQQGTKQRNYRQLEAAESKRLPTKFAKAVPFAVYCSTWNNFDGSFEPGLTALSEPRIGVTHVH